MRYRLKPHEVEARQVPDLEDGADAAQQFRDLIGWLGGQADMQVDAMRGPVIIIDDDDGQELAGAGDWIVKGGPGEYEVWEAEDFDACFEPA